MYMAGAASAAGNDGPCPVEIAFGESGVPNDCQVTSNRVRCSPLDHHADLIPIPAGVRIAKTFGHDELRGGGLMTAAEIVRPAYRLKSEFSSRVAGGFFADVMTPSHELYPMTVFYGFRLVTASDWGLSTAIAEQITNHFSNADLVKTGSQGLIVITNTDPFPHQLIESIRGASL